MTEIIKLNKRHMKGIVDIDIESQHQNTMAFNKTYREKELIKRFKEKQEIFFGYKKDNELVGYVTLKPFFPGHKHCEVYWLAVKNKYQGQGIGKKLMKFIETYAKKQGFRKICIYTGKNMKKTRKFYEKIGYKHINDFPKYYGFAKGNTTAVMYYKELK